MSSFLSNLIATKEPAKTTCFQGGPVELDSKFSVRDEDDEDGGAKATSPADGVTRLHLFDYHSCI